MIALSIRPESYDMFGEIRLWVWLIVTWVPGYVLRTWQSRGYLGQLPLQGRCLCFLKSRRPPRPNSCELFIILLCSWQLCVSIVIVSLDVHERGRHTRVGNNIASFLIESLRTGFISVCWAPMAFGMIQSVDVHIVEVAWVLSKSKQVLHMSTLTGVLKV